MKFAFLFSFIVAINHSIPKDMGDCVRYDVEITLDSGSKLSGVIQLVAYFDVDPTLAEQDSLLFDLLNRNREKVPLFQANSMH